MIPRIAPLALAMVGLGAWALGLGVLTGRPELFAVALPFVLVLATLARTTAPPPCEISHSTSADRLFEGDRLTVTVTVTAQRPIALVELAGPWPAGSAVVAGKRRAAMALRSGETRQWSYDLHFPARGSHDLGTVAFRVRDRFGLLAWEGTHADPHPLRVFPRIEPARTLPRPAHAKASVGDYVSPALGEGLEPGDIREFAPGDRIRQVNWRASLRLGRLYVTQHHRERNADVVLMIDTLAEVGASPDTTLDHAVRAAASLATAYLARKDRVGLIAYGGVVHWVKPAFGRAQYERLADALTRAGVVFTYVAKDLAVVPPRVLPPQALVVAITPLLDQRFARAALDLAARGFDVVALVVCPVAVTRAAVRPTPIANLACRLWTLERRATLADLRRRGIPVVEWRPPEPLEAALAAGARRRIRLPAAG